MRFNFLILEPPYEVIITLKKWIDKDLCFLGLLSFHVRMHVKVHHWGLKTTTYIYKADVSKEDNTIREIRCNDLQNYLHRFLWDIKATYLPERSKSNEKDIPKLFVTSAILFKFRNYKGMYT